jgi:hypothetical protein
VLCGRAVPVAVDELVVPDVAKYPTAENVLPPAPDRPDVATPVLATLMLLDSTPPPPAPLSGAAVDAPLPAVVLLPSVPNQSVDRFVDDAAAADDAAASDTGTVDGTTLTLPSAAVAARLLLSFDAGAFSVGSATFSASAATAAAPQRASPAATACNDAGERKQGRDAGVVSTANGDESRQTSTHPQSAT